MKRNALGLHSLPKIYCLDWNKNDIEDWKP